MDYVNSTMESSTIQIIKPNEDIPSTCTFCTHRLNGKVMVFNEISEKKSDSIPSISDEHSLNFTDSLYDHQINSSEVIIRSIMEKIVSETESNESHQNKNKNIDDSKLPARTLRSHTKDRSDSIILKRTLVHNQNMSHRKDVLNKKNISRHTNYIESYEYTMKDNPNSLKTDKISTVDNDGNETNSIDNIKRTRYQSDFILLPPNKRRMRERSVIAQNSSANTDDASSVVKPRDLPMNCIKQYLEIRRQITERHDTMRNDLIQPKIPKEFSQTLMARKNYLINPLNKTFSTTTPESIGIERLHPPSELNTHLSDIFNRQEDDRYRLKLRHQIEREKLMLSYEQDILRLYGNATRSSANQNIPFSYCSLLKDSEIYNDPSKIKHSSIPFISNDFSNIECSKRYKNRWNGRTFIKSIEDSNLKYKRLSSEISQRHNLEVDTLYSMQRMVWLKHLSKESSSSSTRINSLLSERYLPKVEVNTTFWTSWEIN